MAEGRDARAGGPEQVTLKESPVSHVATLEALGYLRSLFGQTGAVGCSLAATAVAGLEPPETVAASAQALAQDLLDGVEAEP
ncbi:hypothetical protein DYH09_29140 [bacterium CPR1]|nr:hypothetical protein [bacterium CPR1]